MAKVTRNEWYERVNAAWGEVNVERALALDVAPTPEEAVRAARKLFRFATGQTWEGPVRVTSGNRYTWVNGGALTVNPDRRGRYRGWVSLVHDLSHYLHRYHINPGVRPHTGKHARLEISLIKEVIKRGWLNGSLKAPEPVAVAPDQQAQRDREVALERLYARRKAWKTKLARAENAIRRINRSITARERHQRMKE